MEEIENWVDIPGYDGLYRVSNLGNVISINFHNTGRPKPLRQENVKNGYRRVTLSKDGRTKRFSVHRLVAIVFIPNPHNYPCINHKDENPSNNRIDNLEWCTVQYNTKYGSGIKKMIESRNRTRGKARESPIMQLSMDGGIIRTYKSLHEASRQTGLCVENICATLKGRHKTAGGTKWRYIEEVED